MNSNIVLYIIILYDLIVHVHVLVNVSGFRYLTKS